MARRPLEREQVYLDGGRRTTQLMRDSLGSTTKGVLMCFQPRLVTLATLVFIIAACTSRRASLDQPQYGLRTELLGCYALYKPDGKLLDSSYHNSSPLVRLDSTLSKLGGSPRTPFRYLIRFDSTGSHLTTDGPRSLWIDRTWLADTTSDSIRLYFLDNLSGVEAILAAPRDRIADTLSGRIEERWDTVSSSKPRGAVRALRIKCDGAA